jgi:hypothetical protein
VDCCSFPEQKRPRRDAEAESTALARCSRGHRFKLIENVPRIFEGKEALVGTSFGWPTLLPRRSILQTAPTIA